MDDREVVVLRFNIEHYRARLVTEPEGPRRQMLLRQLSDEEAKLVSLVPASEQQMRRRRAKRTKQTTNK
jgi:hypothetical protein